MMCVKVVDFMAGTDRRLQDGDMEHLFKRNWIWYNALKAGNNKIAWFRLNVKKM